MRRAIIEYGAPSALLLLGVGLVMAPGLNADLPGRDAGVFLYAGSRIAEGEIPYLDVWDHKGPLIYYINALGVAVTPGSETGVWLLEAFALFGFGLALYRTLREAFGRVPAGLAVAACFGGLGYTLAPGNYTEEFALPFQVVALLLFARAGTASAGRYDWFVAGLTGAAAFLLRPDNAGLHFAIGAYLALASFRDGTGQRVLAHFGLGAAAGLAPVAAYFAANGALLAMLDALFRFNAVYVQATIKARVEAVLEGFRLLAPTGLPLLALAAWIPACLTLRRGGELDRRGRLVALAAIALPIELLLTAAAGRSLDHYYLSWLPAVAILAAYLLSRISEPAASRGQRASSLTAPRGAWTFGLAIAMLLLPARRLIPPFLELMRHGPRQSAAVTAELAQFESAHLLMWGAESSYNFLSGLSAPTRFVYQYPLYTCGYVTVEMANQFERDVRRGRPLIVDSSSTNPSVPPLDAQEREHWSAETDNCALTAPMLSLLDFIDSNYEIVGHTAYAGWPIYRIED